MNFSLNISIKSLYTYQIGEKEREFKAMIFITVRDMDNKFLSSTADILVEENLAS